MEWAQTSLVVCKIHNSVAAKGEQKDACFFNPTLTKKAQKGLVDNPDMGFALLKGMAGKRKTEVINCGKLDKSR